MPFSTTLAGVAIAIFGLSLIARGGLLALIAFVFSAVIMGLVIFNVVV